MAEKFKRLMQRLKRNKTLIINENMEPIVFIQAAGRGGRMGTSSKGLIKINPENPNELLQTNFGRLLAQLEYCGTKKVIVFIREKDKQHKAFVENHPELSIKVEFIEDIGFKGLKGNYQKMQNMLESSQLAVVFNIDDILRTETIEKTLRIAKKGKTRFRAVLGRKISTLRFTNSAFIAGKEHLSEMSRQIPLTAVTENIPKTKLIRRGNWVSFSKSHINLNSRTDVRKARQEVKKRKWRVK